MCAGLRYRPHVDCSLPWAQATHGDSEGQGAWRCSAGLEGSRHNTNNSSHRNHCSTSQIKGWGVGCCLRVDGGLSLRSELSARPLCFSGHHPGQEPARELLGVLSPLQWCSRSRITGHHVSPWDHSQLRRAGAGPRLPCCRYGGGGAGVQIMRRAQWAIRAQPSVPATGLGPAPHRPPSLAGSWLSALNSPPRGNYRWCFPGTLSPRKTPEGGENSQLSTRQTDPWAQIRRSRPTPHHKRPVSATL